MSAPSPPRAPSTEEGYDARYLGSPPTSLPKSSTSDAGQAQRGHQDTAATTGRNDNHSDRAASPDGREQAEASRRTYRDEEEQAGAPIEAPIPEAGQRREQEKPHDEHSLESSHRRTQPDHHDSDGSPDSRPTFARLDTPSEASSSDELPTPSPEPPATRSRKRKSKSEGESKSKSQGEAGTSRLLTHTLDEEKDSSFGSCQEGQVGDLDEGDDEEDDEDDEEEQEEDIKAKLRGSSKRRRSSSAPEQPVRQSKRISSRLRSPSPVATRGNRRSSSRRSTRVTGPSSDRRTRQSSSRDLSVDVHNTRTLPRLVQGAKFTSLETLLQCVDQDLRESPHHCVIVPELYEDGMRMVPIINVHCWSAVVVAKVYGKETFMLPVRRGSAKAKGIQFDPETRAAVKCPVTCQIVRMTEHSKRIVWVVERLIKEHCLECTNRMAKEPEEARKENDEEWAEMVEDIGDGLNLHRRRDIPRSALTRDEAIRMGILSVSEPDSNSSDEEEQDSRHQHSITHPHLHRPVASREDKGYSSEELPLVEASVSRPRKQKGRKRTTSGRTSADVTLVEEEESGGYGDEDKEMEEVEEGFELGPSLREKEASRQKAKSARVSKPGKSERAAASKKARKVRRGSMGSKKLKDVVGKISIPAMLSDYFTQCGFETLQDMADYGITSNEVRTTILAIYNSYLTINMGRSGVAAKTSLTKTPPVFFKYDAIAIHIRQALLELEESLKDDGSVQAEEGDGEGNEEDEGEEDRTSDVD